MNHWFLKNYVFQIHGKFRNPQVCPQMQSGDTFTPVQVILQNAGNMKSKKIDEDLHKNANNCVIQKIYGKQPQLLTMIVFMWYSKERTEMQTVRYMVQWRKIEEITNVVWQHFQACYSVKKIKLTTEISGITNIETANVFV